MLGSKEGEQGVCLVGSQVAFFFGATISTDTNATLRGLRALSVGPILAAQGQISDAVGVKAGDEWPSTAGRNADDPLILSAGQGRVNTRN